MFGWIEQIFCYCGILILGLVALAFFGMTFLILMAWLIELPSRFSKRNKYIIQFLRALKSFGTIVGIGLFIGASIGAAIKSLLYIPATMQGAIIGLLFSSVYAYSYIKPKWGHCYLDQHDYTPNGESTFINDCIELCKWCGKESDC